MKDSRIKELYKNEMVGSAPDKEALWSRIESGLEERSGDIAEAERSLAAEKRRFITLKKCLAFAAVCAVMAIVVPAAVKNTDISSDNAAHIAAEDSYMAEDAAEAANDDEAACESTEETVSITASVLDYNDLSFPESVNSGISCSGEPNGGEYFSEEDILIQTEGFIDAVVSSVYAGGDCIYYELSAVGVYGGIEDSGTITVASRSKYAMLENREYLIPVRTVDGELETVFDGVPQIEFTEDGGMVYYNGWKSLDSEASVSLIYPKNGVDDFFYDRMKFSYKSGVSELIEKWNSIREE